MTTLAERDALVAAIQSLPEEQRLVVSLHFEHELTDREIMRATGWPLSQVIDRFERAMLALTPELRKIVADAPRPPDMLTRALELMRGVH